MRNKFLTLFICFPVLIFSQKNVEWVTNFGGTSPYYGVELGRKIINDTEGNLYVVGDFADTIEIDGKTIISSGDKDIFIAKLNSTGNVLWITNFGSVEADWSGNICIDYNSNIFMTGTFRGELNIGDSTYYSNSWYDIFILKISTEGQLIWSKAFIGEGGNSTNSITIDDDGYFYITGKYGRDLFFDGYHLEGPTARSDLFVVKLNSSGDVIWAKSTKSNANNYGNSIVSDTEGYLYLTGFMWDSVYFDNHLLISTGMMQAYVSKMDASSGEFIWAIGGGGSNAGWSEGNSVIIDNENDIILTGWYRNELYFGDNSVSNGGNDNGPDDIFIAKFDDTGNLIWMKTAQSNLYSNAYDITSNTTNEIFLTGKFRGFIKVEDSIYQSTVSDYFDICVLKFGKNGDFQWLKSFGGNSPMNDIGYGLTTVNNKVFCTGMFSSNSWFDNTYLNCNGASDVYVLSLSDSTTTDLNSTKLNQGINIYPNPCDNEINVKFDNSIQHKYQIKLFNSLSNEIYCNEFSGSDLTIIDLQNNSTGIYFIQITDLENSKTIIKKIVKNN